ncbi:hypothetical protein [Methylobacterium radiodurans]|uniref:Uncharacterized protein n=1 Tax=Methylobacterium radiodurans TaxID=2202828 RepID=A0A2U8VY75_9HYPH|nr:hypothetical protein [Methylobacterium radiodurans]AWN38715.1 hypothetical protein DK427_25790 [Methylobacterium radiodurans]
MDDAITTAFVPLIGLPCWGVQRGHGSMLTFEFGPPYLLITEPYVSNSPAARIRERAAQRHVRPCGAWHLFIFCCHWRIAVSGEVLAEDESPADLIEAAVRVGNGQKLTAFALDATTRTTTFTFDLGASLTTWPYADEIDEPWSLYQPEGQVLTYRSDGCRNLGSDDEQPDRHVWIPVHLDVRVP